MAGVNRQRAADAGRKRRQGVQAGRGEGAVAQEPALGRGSRLMLRHGLGMSWKVSEGARHGAQRSTGSEVVGGFGRSEEHTSELQSLMRISYAVFCLPKKKNKTHQTIDQIS